MHTAPISLMTVNLRTLSQLHNYTLPGCWANLQVQKRLHQHEVAVLAEGPARQLFRRAAGLERGMQLTATLQGLEAAILRICNGLPLALELVGGQLHSDLEPSSWEVMPARLLSLRMWQSNQQHAAPYLELEGAPIWIATIGGIHATTIIK
jgi:hypothetical protein